MDVLIVLVRKRTNIFGPTIIDITTLDFWKLRLRLF